MAAEPSLAQALTDEHHVIDAGIEQFVAGLQRDEPLAALVAPLREAMTALRRHIYLEEEFAFPPIREGGLIMPIMVMEREHGVLWRQMDSLEAQLDAAGADSADGGSAAGDSADGISANGISADGRERILALCEEMIRVLQEHNSKEEPIVYPHVDVQLSEAQRSQLADLISRGQTPEGWVCTRARE